VLEPTRRGRLPETLSRLSGGTMPAIGLRCEAFLRRFEKGLAARWANELRKCITEANGVNASFRSDSILDASARGLRLVGQFGI
jgi:hypothetical protein